MIKICNCKRCGHEWASKQEKPLICPACQSRQWDNDMVVIMSDIHHVCGRCKWEWNGKENPIRCPRCQSLKWRQERQLHNHMCQKCLKKWKSEVEKPYKCPSCQTQMEKSKREIYNHMCQKCFHEWKSGLLKPQKCPKCQTWMEVKQKIETYKYVNGRRIGTRCVCSAWYPLVEGRVRYRCPRCKSGAGGTVEIEKPEIGNEENWGPL